MSKSAFFLRPSKSVTTVFLSVPLTSSHFMLNRSFNFLLVPSIRAILFVQASAKAEYGRKEDKYYEQ